MSDLVIGDRPLLGIGEDRVLLLVAGNDNLDAFFEVCLRNCTAMISDCTQRRLIDDIRQLRAGGAGGHAGNLFKVDLALDFHFFCRDLEDILASLEIRQFDRNTTVKPARSGQRRVEGFRTVGRCQDNDAVVALETVHLGQQLVQGLLAFIVAGKLSVTLLADGIDLVDEYNARRLFLRLFEEVTHLGCAHTDEHLDEFRAGHGEERNVRFARNGFGQQGFTGTRRAHEQNALWHRRTDLLVAVRIMQILHDLGEVFLGLVLARNIREFDAVRGFDIDLGIGLTHAEDHRIAVLAAHHFFRHVLSQRHEDQNRQNPGQQHIRQR